MCLAPNPCDAAGKYGIDQGGRETITEGPSSNGFTSMVEMSSGLYDIHSTYLAKRYALIQ